MKAREVLFLAFYAVSIALMVGSSCSQCVNKGRCEDSRGYWISADDFWDFDGGKCLHMHGEAEETNP